MWGTGRVRRPGFHSQYSWGDENKYEMVTILKKYVSTKMFQKLATMHHGTAQTLVLLLAKSEIL
jgi:hypothetical protein